MDKRLRQLLVLVKKTGDRLVVYDSANNDAPFVLMGIAAYERLVDGRMKKDFIPPSGEAAQPAENISFSAEPVLEPATMPVQDQVGEDTSKESDKYYFEALESESDEVSE